MALIPTLDSSLKLRKKFLSAQSLSELAVEANVWRTAQDNRYVTRAEYVAGGSGIAPTIFDAKGDLIVASAADTPLRLAVGANGRQLIADSNDVAGVKWGERPALYTNVITNPSVETNLTGVTARGSGSTVTRVTTDFYVGAASARAVCDGTVIEQGVQFDTISIPAGRYGGGVWVKGSAGAPLRAFLAGTNFNPGGSVDFVATGDWQRVVVPAGSLTATSTIRIAVVTQTATATTIFADAALVLAGTDVPDYFDGDTAGCYWTGTAHASTSVRAALSATDGVARASLPTLTRNLITNPSFELGLTGWSLYNGAAGPSRSTTGPAVGVAGLLTNTSGTVANSGVETSTRPRVTAGQPYTASATIGGVAGVTYAIELAYFDEAGAAVGTPAVTSFVYPGAFTRQQASAVAPATAASAAIRIYRLGTGASQTLRVDAAQLEQGVRATAYVDGDQKGCYWTGAPHASESVRMVRGGEAVTKLEAPEQARNLVLNPSLEDPGVGNFAAAGQFGGRVVTRVADTSFGTGAFVAETGPANNGDARYLRGNTYSGFRAGDTVRAQHDVKVTSGTSTPATHFWAKSGGTATVTNDRTRRIDLGNGSWRIITDFLVSGAGTLELSATTTVGANDSTHRVDRLAVIAYPNGTPSGNDLYFDGDSSGCYWLGFPHLSESVRYINVADHSMLVWLDAGRAQGTGSPEGVVTAPVGTRYVDTAGTVGATEWQKWTGTGSTGWVATGADTGDRLVASGITNLGDATVVVRRVGSQVTVTLIQGTAGTATGTVSLATLPVGFRPTRTGSIVAAPVVTQAGALVTGAALTVAADAGGVVLTGATNATRHYAQVTYTTANAYPTTLPGTAA